MAAREQDSERQLNTVWIPYLFFFVSLLPVSSLIGQKLTGRQAITGKHKKNPIIRSVSFSVLLMSSLFLFKKVRGLREGHFNYNLPFKNVISFNISKCPICLMISIELHNEAVYRKISKEECISTE